MKGTRCFCYVVICLLAGGLHVSGADGGEAPFKAGQIVVAGRPADLPAGAALIKHLPSANLCIVSVPPGRERGEVQRLRARGRRAGLNRLVRAFELDPYYRYQWHFPAVQAEQAWDLTDGAGVVVAVLDTGLAPAPADRDGIAHVVAGRDVVNSDNDPSDGDGHGTHVAGTVGQATGNGVGVAGLAHGAAIMPVKVLDDTGTGTFADIAEGIFWAVDHGAQVINMSLGTDARWGIRSDISVDPALEYAFSSDVTVVCAAGNDGNRSLVSYPAIYPTTIAVGATDLRNAVTRYSNRGEGLDLVAPGGSLSRDVDRDGYPDGVLQETRINGNWAYYFFEGTSMASPHVAAAAALLISYGSAETPEEVLAALAASALDLGAAGYDSESGFGLLQAYGALTVVGGCTDADGDGWCVEDGDCDDADRFVNPGAEEVCGDGVDNNCDGAVDEGCEGGCTDADGDGWCVEDGDCDDGDPSVYPGHPDKRGRWGRDGVDNDCNGIVDG